MRDTTELKICPENELFSRRKKAEKKAMLTWRLFGCLQQGLVRATSQVSSPKKDSTDIVSRQK